MKEIPLTRGKIGRPHNGTKPVRFPTGKVALVDDCDFDWAMQWNWSPHSAGYAVRIEGTNGKRTPLLMHVEIAKRMGLNLTADVDHRNLIPLDNQRHNLRPATRSQNMANCPVRSTNTSGFKGVHWSKAHQKWRAVIMKNYKTYALGSFSTPEEASVAYQNAAKEMFGEYAFS